MIKSSSRTSIVQHEADEFGDLFVVRVKQKISLWETHCDKNLMFDV